MIGSAVQILQLLCIVYLYHIYILYVPLTLYAGVQQREDVCSGNNSNETSLTAAVVAVLRVTLRSCLFLD